MSARALMGVLILASACQLAGPPQLVRDGAGIFSAEARATAESRLRAVAAEHGVWAFVITDLEGDPPRMLDGPMGEADARGARAVAALFRPDSMAAGGFSRVSYDAGDSQTYSPPNVDSLLTGGKADEALEITVDYLESWAELPPPGEPLPVDPVNAPSAAPGPT